MTVEASVEEQVIRQAVELHKTTDEGTLLDHSGFCFYLRSDLVKQGLGQNPRDSLRKMLDGIPRFYSIQTREDAADLMMENLADYMGDAEYFVYLESDGMGEAHGPVYRGSGLFAAEQNRVSAYFEESGKAEGKLILQDGLMIAPLADESQSCYGIMGIRPR